MTKSDLSLIRRVADDIESTGMEANTFRRDLVVDCLRTTAQRIEHLEGCIGALEAELAVQIGKANRAEAALVDQFAERLADEFAARIKP
jgi:hypothetical protein